VATRLKLPKLDADRLSKGLQKQFPDGFPNYAEGYVLREVRPKRTFATKFAEDSYTGRVKVKREAFLEGRKPVQKKRNKKKGGARKKDEHFERVLTAAPDLICESRWASVVSKHGAEAAAEMDPKVLRAELVEDAWEDLADDFADSLKLAKNGNATLTEKILRGIMARKASKFEVEKSSN